MEGTQPTAGQAGQAGQRGWRLASPATAAVFGGVVLALMIAELPLAGLARRASTTATAPAGGGPAVQPGPV